MQSKTADHRSPTARLPYEPRNYEHLLGMQGFSDRLLKNHFKLYEAYVTNTNELNEKIHQSQGKDQAKELSELRRRYGWEFNGMRLHEYYFDNLGGKEELGSHESASSLIKSSFGSEADWKKDFVAAGAMRGIGWVILYQDGETGKLFNAWINEHESGHFAGSHPLLVLDVFEHAYMVDYDTDKSKYITAFFDNINWDVVNSRLRLELVEA